MGEAYVISLRCQQDALTDKECNTLKTAGTELVCQHLQGSRSTMPV